MVEASSREQRRIYLDNAATSWPKHPAAVSAAVEFIQDCGAASGRGAYRSAQVADRWVQRARMAIARMIGAPSGASVAMCTSGTHALNAALGGLLRPGQRVVTTAAEHNSVLRPLSQLSRKGEATVDFIPCDRAGIADLEMARDALSEGCDWVVLGHASNVTGAVQDLATWCRLAKEFGARIIVDAAQTVGYLPIDVAGLGIDVLAAPGHKGLRALVGTGLLYVAPELQSEVRPLMRGGTGRASHDVEHNDTWPCSVEVGNLNLPGIVSMAVAAEALVEGGGQDWRPAFQRLARGIADLPGLRVLGWGQADVDLQRHVPVLSILPDAWDVHDLASVLDVNFGVEVRAGYHCAALIHGYLGSSDAGGTLRLSTCQATPIEHVDAALQALGNVLAAPIV